jgi:uncharacterized protein YigE (DUF2233 family)
MAAVSSLHRHASLFALLIPLLLSACSAPPAEPTLATTAVLPPVTLFPAQPTAPAQPIEPIDPIQSTATPFGAQYDGEWKPAMAGMEYMLAEFTVNARKELVLMTRIDPALTAIRVHYDPLQPQSVRQWQAATQAGLIINAGFFNTQNQATGLVIADGTSSSRSYRGFGGMFSVGQDGAPALQWLRDEPYRADETIAQAVQGFPMLVVNGERIETMDDNGERNRRSFVALDAQGRVLLGVTQMAQWSLTDLADFLAGAETLNVVSALNLDGGASSGLWLAGPLDGLSMNSFDPVPAVISVTPR